MEHSFARRMEQIWREIPRWQKWAFALAAVAILVAAIAAQVESERHNYLHKDIPGSPVRVVDLDFVAYSTVQAGQAFYSVGPLGQVDIGSAPAEHFITYRSGREYASLTPAGSTYSGLNWWRGGVGATPPTADGVHARYENLFPSTAGAVVAGIDGVELTLELRSRPFVGTGDLTYDFWLDTSQGLYPAGPQGPLLTGSTARASVAGAISLKDGSGRTVFTITPASALVQFNAAPRPVRDRSISVIDPPLPAHEQGERASIPLEYVVERIEGRYAVSVVVPVEMFYDPAIAWPIMIDPGITNPIANSSYFADETILMDSDLTVTSSGAAQFSNVTLVMNRTSAPNYNITVDQGGRMTLLSSSVKSNDSAVPYRFTVNGSFTAQDTIIRHANDGLQLRGPSATLSNVTLQNGTGRALVEIGGNASLARVQIPDSAGTGLFVQNATLQAQFVNVTRAGGEGAYLNATGGNLSWSHFLNSTLNGALVVNSSGINITHSEFAGSTRNGVLVIGGKPSLEDSSITANNWSGVVLFDDHSAFVSGNLIAHNNWSGVETRLNSTADLYGNTIESNAKAGIRAVAADPNIESNTISENDMGVWLEGAHNPGGKPGATSATESGYSYLLAASSELGADGREILAAGVSIIHLGASTQKAPVPCTCQFSLQVKNTDTGGGNKAIALSIDDDQQAWASLSQTSLTLGPQATATVTLTVSVPPNTATAWTYDVKIWANETASPFPKASVWAYIDLAANTAVAVTSVTTTNQSTISLTGTLTSGGQPVSGKTLAFKLDGHWVGEATTDSNGVASVSKTVSQPPTSQVLLVYFNGTQYLFGSNGLGYVNITWTASLLQAPAAQGRWSDSSAITVRLLATPGLYPAAGRPIYFTLDGGFVAKVDTDWQGYASFVFDDQFEPGTYNWNASFDGDLYTGESANSSTFEGLKDLINITGDAFAIRQGETAYHVAFLSDDEGNALASRTLTIKRGGTTLATPTTDSGGYATYADTGAQSLSEGNYSMTYEFAAEAHYVGFVHYLTLTVRKWSTWFNLSDQSEYYGDGGTLLAQLRDEDGNNLSSRLVGVYVNGAFRANVTTNATGWAIYADDQMIAASTYSMRFLYYTTTRDFAAEATANLTIVREITQFAVVADARIGTGDVLALTLRLTDNDGNGIAKPVHGTLLGGAFYSGTTDSSGYLTVNFDARGLTPQRYNLWHWFDGDANYTAAEAYTRIVVEYDADLHANVIEHNRLGVSANNSSSKLVGNRISSNYANVVVSNGSLLIYNSSVGLSEFADFWLTTGGSIYSTNTSFNRGKVELGAGAVLLHVRWLLNVDLLVPPGPDPANGIEMILRNVTGDIILDKTTNSQGWFGEEAVTEYTQNASGKLLRTPHKLQVEYYNVSLLMDVSRNMTLYKGADADNDGLMNWEEDASDVYWVEAEAHSLEYTQIDEIPQASGGRAVHALAGDGRFLDAGTFLSFEAGNYSLMVRARAATTTGKLRAVVKDPSGTVLLNLSFVPSTLFRWFQTPMFVVGSAESLSINVTDESGAPAADAVELDEIAVARMTLLNGTVTHRPGQLSSPIQADVDKDAALDGAEIRQGTTWLETETLVPWEAGRQVSDVNASNSWAVGHPSGTTQVAVLNATWFDRPGIYAVWLRARGNGTAGNVTWELWINGSLNLTGSVNVAAGYDWASFRFEYMPGQSILVKLIDGADTSGGHTVPTTFIDKAGVILELSRPFVQGFSRFDDVAKRPAEGTTAVFVPEDASFLAMVYWVANDTIYGVPFVTFTGNSTFQPTWSYAIGTNPSQPVLGKLHDGTQILITTGGNFVYVFRLPLDMNPLSFNVSLMIADHQQILGVAYTDGWIVGSTRFGKVYGLEVTRTTLLPKWLFDAGLGEAHGVAAIYHDKAYFGFFSGLLAIKYNTTTPAAEAWRIGPQGWTDPPAACPQALMPCPGSPDPTVDRNVTAAPLFDMGNLFVLAYNLTETDLYRLTEDGETLWALNTGLPTVYPANWTAPQLVLRGDQVIVMGTQLKVYDRTTGALVLGHNFSFPYTDNIYASAVVTDREIIAPGNDGMYFLQWDAQQEWGDNFPADMANTFGAQKKEDVLWRQPDWSYLNRQPLVGDFDHSGYRDLLYPNWTGFIFVKDFEVGYRGYVEFGQLGRDSGHGGNAEFLYHYTPTDPMDPDGDHDNLADGREITDYYGYAQVEAEDATEFHAWSDSAVNGSAKNFNFFHQTGVTLTADDGNYSYGEGQNVSWIRVPAFVDSPGTYKVTLIPNLDVKDIVDLRYAEGNSASPSSVNTSEGYGVEASLQDRVYIPTAETLQLNESQGERVRQMVENATYMRVGYSSLYGAGNYTSFGTGRNATVTLYKGTYDPNTKKKAQLVVFVSMEFEFELYGPKAYSFEVGINLSLIPSAGMGGSSLGPNLSLLRILDLDKLRIDKRGLSPVYADSDHDGVLDGDEAGGFPWTGDLDQDGISDWTEINVYGTNPGDRDTDHDGIRDRVELGMTQADNDPATIYDDHESLASYPEWQATKFRGDPHYRAPTYGRTLPNWDADPGTVTDPRDPDTDDDGIPDGWVDGWTYDPSGIGTEIANAAGSTKEYMQRAQPIEYDVNNWHQSGVYDNYEEIWEGEDANLDGAVQGNQSSSNPDEHWSFWVSTVDPAGGFKDATRLGFIRKGMGESDAANPDTDGDHLPEGYEVFYATQEPILTDPAVSDSYFFTPITDDGWKDNDMEYGTPPVNLTPTSTLNQALTDHANLAEGIMIPDPDPATARLVSSIALNLKGITNGTGVTMEVWQSAHSSSTPASPLVSATGLLKDQQEWVFFHFAAQWLNFTANHYYAVLKGETANVLWYTNDSAPTTYWYKRNETGVWSSASIGSHGPAIRVYDYFSQAGDGLNNTEEYLIGTNPKLGDTDEHTAGPLSNLGDLMKDGTEAANHTIFRTNAKRGAFNSLYYGDGSWILFDPSLTTNETSDWMYYQWLENVTGPNESFSGAKNRSTYMFTLADGSELRINLSANRLYIYKPGANFEDTEELQNLSNVTHFYNGTAIVFARVNASGITDAYKTNKVIAVQSDPLLFQMKQFYFSDPFDWDTDNDGLADGWEYGLSGLNDTDGDGVPDVRDIDSDNDGLTDGQEMLQAVGGWSGEVYNGPMDAALDPDGDGLYPMRDTDSDGDGIPDAKEVLWSVDTDHDRRINLIDADSDGDGLCDGWCTYASTTPWRVNTSASYYPWQFFFPSQLPSGEDTNQNGTNEQNESSPIKPDTDGDGLWDGPANSNGLNSGWALTGVDGSWCPEHPSPAQFCGEESTYALFPGGPSTGKTNRTNGDTDGDGLGDLAEVHGHTFTVTLVGGTQRQNLSVSDPTVVDTDGDGLSDPIEAALGTNASYNDSDLDGLLDPIEDRNGDSARQWNETSAAMQDTDWDGLTDGQEDIDHDGVRDSNEPDPLNPQSDGDMIPDGTEFQLMLSKNGAWTLTHDTDGDGVPDILDIDADNDGLTDFEEDYNANATIDITESDPYVNDTDGDGLLDGAEPLPFEDTDGDGNINARDNDSNNDSVGDAAQVWIQFRTNATNGQYGAGTWVALIAPKANPYYPDQFDYTASNALYVYSSTTTSPAGGVIQDPYGPTAPPPSNVKALQTPEGYLVYANWNAGTSSYDVFVQISPTHSAKYVKSSSAPSDYSPSNRSLQPFTGLNQETYDGRVAVSNDTDFDGISNGIESNAGLNATNNDTDGDGLLDGLEWGGGVDTDHDGLLDAKDKDSDNDGIPDGTEDANHNGFLDAGETDPHRQDSDGDGIKDGYETGVTAAPSTDTTDCFIGGGSCPDKWAFTAATSNSPRTSPLDRDTDDDGIGDKVEEDGSWCYVDLDHATCTYSADSTHVTDPTKLDTDGDGLSDGLEIGLMSAGVGTDLAKFKSDQGPGTHTDPTKADTDGDGLTDGQEDANLDGRTQSKETYGWMWDSDSDGLCDGLCGSKGEDVNKNGIRDQDADGNWTETDPLANDSDVDGILDGQEVNGSWCYSGQVGCTPGVGSDSSRVLQPLNADTDEDGLRDGQEIAGWQVGLWREITMESIRNYTVTSDPNDADSDNDNNADFVEFQNGSDPRNTDTDGDLIDDWTEVNRSQDVTGFYMQPPVISNWDIHKESLGGGLVGIGDRVVARVQFDLSSYWGLNNWVVFYGQPNMNDTALAEFNALLPKSIGGDKSAKQRVNELQLSSMIVGQIRFGNLLGAKTRHVDVEFNMTTAEDLVVGAWVRAGASDVYGAGIQKTVKVKSALEAVVDFMNAVANAVAEAASHLVDWIWGMMSWALSLITSPIVNALDAWLRGFERTSDRVASAGEPDQSGFDAMMSAYLGPLYPVFKMLVDAMQAIMAVLKPIFDFIKDLVRPVIEFIGALISDALGTGSAEPDQDSSTQANGEDFYGFLTRSAETHRFTAEESIHLFILIAAFISVWVSGLVLALALSNEVGIGGLIFSLGLTILLGTLTALLTWKIATGSKSKLALFFGFAVAGALFVLDMSEFAEIATLRETESGDLVELLSLPGGLLLFLGWVASTAANFFAFLYAGHEFLYCHCPTV